MLINEIITLKKQAFKYHLNNDLDKALLYYAKVLELNPKDLASINNTATIYADRNLWEKAKKHFEKVITIEPNSSSAYCNLALYHEKRSKHRFDFSFKIAEFFLKKAIRIGPNYLAWFNLTRLYFNAKTYDKSLAVALKANSFSGEKDQLSELEMLMYLLSSKLRLSDYNEMDKYEKALKEKMKGCLEIKKLAMVCSFNVQMVEYSDEFYHNYTRTSYTIRQSQNSKNNNLDGIADLHEKEVKVVETSYKNRIIKRNTQKNNDRIALGYISSDLKSHSVSLLMGDIFKLHDESAFKVCVFYTGAYEDEISEGIKENVEIFHHICIKTEQRKLYDVLLEEQLDVIVDLNGHTGFTALPLLTNNIAPIQCHMVGYYGPLCVKEIQYFIGNNKLIPDDDRGFFKENIIFMPEVLHASPKFYGSDEVYNTKISLGLPEDKFIFASFSSSYRIDLKNIGIWIKLLIECPNGILWLNVYDRIARTNLRNYLEENGISRDRIIILDDVMLTETKANRFVDIYLDTTTISAGTSSFLSLSAGVPIITLPSKRPESRTTTAILSGFGLQNLIASTPDDYIAKAAYYYHNPKELILLKQKIINSRDITPVFNQARFTAYLEKGFEQACQHYKDTKGYTDIFVKQESIY